MRKKIHQAKFCLCVKADAYGHGLVPIAKAAEKSGLVDYLAVACLQEGLALRSSGCNLPILVLGAIDAEQVETLVSSNLEFTLSSSYKADMVLSECARVGKRCRAHVEVDTGLKRTGMRPETALLLIQKLQSSQYIDLVGVYSHFATADVPNDSFAQHQIQEMKELRQKVEGSRFLETVNKNKSVNSLLWHLANSGGILFYPESHMDMVRSGILCYGYLPGSEGIAEPKPCYSVKAKISYFKVVRAGEGVSYGHTYRPARDTHIVTVPLGYGDGVRRAFAKQGQVLIRGKRYPVVGNICMDQLMVDIGSDTAYVGDEVVLIGRQGDAEISLLEFASWIQTNAYETLCSFNGRLSKNHFG